MAYTEMQLPEWSSNDLFEETFCDHFFGATYEVNWISTQNIIKQHPLLLWSDDGYGMRPLHHARENEKNKDMVKYLTDREGEMLRGGQRPSPELADRILQKDEQLAFKIMKGLGTATDHDMAIVKNILTVHPQGCNSVLSSYEPYLSDRIFVCRSLAYLNISSCLKH